MKDFNMIEIENINIFKNFKDERYNSCTIIYKSSEGRPYLLYIEKIDSKTNITSNITEPSFEFVLSRQDFSLNNRIIPVDGTAYRTIDLSFEPGETK